MSWLSILALQQAHQTPVVPTPAVSIARIFIGGGFIVFSLGMVRLLLRALGLDASPSHPTRPTWGVLQIGGILVLFVVVEAVVSLFIRPSEVDLTQSLVLSVVVFGSLVAAAIGVAGARGREGLEAFGLRPYGNVLAMVVSAGSYVLFIPCYIGAGLLWNSFLALLGHDVKPQDIMTALTSLEAGHRLVPVLIGVLVIPFLEEALFRGFLQPVLVQWFRPWMGITVTSALFGWLHGLDAFLPIFALAMLLGWMRHATQRLTASYAIHAMHNGLMLYVAFHHPQLAEAGDRVGLFHCVS